MRYGIWFWDKESNRKEKEAQHGNFAGIRVSEVHFLRSPTVGARLKIPRKRVYARNRFQRSDALVLVRLNFEESSGVQIQVPKAGKSLCGVDRTLALAGS